MQGSKGDKDIRNRLWDSLEEGEGGMIFYIRGFTGGSVVKNPPA